MNAFNQNAVRAGLVLAGLALSAVSGVEAQDSPGSTPALEASRTAVERLPRSPAARLQYARALSAGGDIGAAFDQIEKGLGFAPDNPDLLYYAIEYSAALGRRELETLHETAPDSSRSHQLLGEIADAQRDSVRAVAEYETAVERDPGNYEALVALADTERSSSLCEKAIPHYERLIAHNSQDTDSLFGLGMCQLAAGDTGKATEIFGQVVARLPGYAAAQYQLGHSLFMAGDAKRALPHLQAAVRLEPKFKQGYFLLGRAYKSLGNSPQAVAALDKFKALENAELKAAEKRNSELRQPGPEPQQ